MASGCFVCGKTHHVGMQVSHSHRRSKRRWYPNLQNFRTRVGGHVKKVQVCTKCIKAGKIQKVV